MSKTSVGCYFIVACLPNSNVFSNENITSWRKTDYRMWISSDFSRFFESQVLDKQFEEPPESRGISFQRQQFSLQFTPWCCKHELMFNGLIFFVCPSLCVLIVVCLRRPKHGIVRLNLNQKQTELFERKVPKECIFWVSQTLVTHATHEARKENAQRDVGESLVGLRREMPYLCTGVPFQDTMILIIYLLFAKTTFVCLNQPICCFWRARNCRTMSVL